MMVNGNVFVIGKDGLALVTIPPKGKIKTFQFKNNHKKMENT